jgi:hypothetical protein
MASGDFPLASGAAGGSLIIAAETFLSLEGGGA